MVEKVCASDGRISAKRLLPFARVTGYAGSARNLPPRHHRGPPTSSSGARIGCVYLHEASTSSAIGRPRRAGGNCSEKGAKRASRRGVDVSRCAREAPTPADESDLRGQPPDGRAIWRTTRSRSASRPGLAGPPVYPAVPAATRQDHAGRAGTPPGAEVGDRLEKETLRAGADATAERLVAGGGGKHLVRGGVAEVPIGVANRHRFATCWPSCLEAGAQRRKRLPLSSQCQRRARRAGGRPPARPGGPSRRATTRGRSGSKHCRLRRPAPAPAPGRQVAPPGCGRPRQPDQRRGAGSCGAAQSRGRAVRAATHDARLPPRRAGLIPWGLAGHS